MTVPTRKVVVANTELSLGSELGATIFRPSTGPRHRSRGRFRGPRGTRGPRPDCLGRATRAASARQARLQGSRQRAAADYPGRQTGPVGPSQRSHRRRRLRAARDPRRRRCDRRRPTARAESMTSKVVLSNVEVLTAGTRLEQDSKDSKPIQVTVVTLARHAGRSRAADPCEHRRQDSARPSESARPRVARNGWRAVRLLIGSVQQRPGAPGRVGARLFPEATPAPHPHSRRQPLKSSVATRRRLGHRSDRRLKK